jgi:hypothetical protein
MRIPAAWGGGIEKMEAIKGQGEIIKAKMRQTK